MEMQDLMAETGHVWKWKPRDRVYLWSGDYRVPEGMEPWGEPLRYIMLSVN